MRLSLLIAILLPMAAQGQTVRDSIITVTESRTSRVTPDRASIFLTIEGTAETVVDAVARVETKIKPVLDALKARGGLGEIDRPIAYGVGPTLLPNGYPGVASPATYIARSVIRVNLIRADQVAAVVAAALGAGAASASSPVFESSVADSIRRARTTEALTVAKLDAQAIAASLDGRLGALVEVSSSAIGFNFSGTTFLTFDNRFGQQTPAPEVVIAMQVTVRYRLIH